MSVEHELAALRHVHAVLDRAARDLRAVASGLDEAVTLELWTGPVAEELRTAWRAQRDMVLPVLADLVAASAEDVRVQHNNLAEATAQPDRL